MRFARAKTIHADQVAADLHPMDREEMAALGVVDLRAQVRLALERSRDARAIMTPAGEAVAVFGVMALDAETAIPWMLSRHDVAKASRLLSRHARRWVRAWGRLFPTLVGATHVDCTHHHRFIEWAGFKWDGEASIRGAQFRVFRNV